MAEASFHTELGKQTRAGHTSHQVPISKAQDLIARLTDRRVNRLSPHQCGRKLEKKAGTLGAVAGGLAGAGLGAAFAPQKKKGFGILAGGLAGAGLGSMTGNSSPGASSTSTATPAATPTPPTPAAPATPGPAAPSLAQIAGRAYGQSAVNNPIPTAAGTIYGLDAARMMTNLGIHAANLVPKGINALAGTALRTLPRIPGGALMNKAAPVLSEAMSFKTNPQQGLQDSAQRMTAPVTNFDTSRHGVNLSNVVNLASNPLVLDAGRMALTRGSPAFTAVNTAADLAQGARQAFRQGGGNPIRGYNRMADTLMQNSDDGPDLATHSNWQALKNIAGYGVKHLGERGKEPISTFTALGRNLVQMDHAGALGGTPEEQNHQLYQPSDNPAGGGDVYGP